MRRPVWGKTGWAVSCTLEASHSTSYPAPLPFTLFHPVPGFHAVSLIQHSHPSLCTDCSCMLCKLPPSHLVSTALHCIAGRVCPKGDVLHRLRPFGPSSCEVSRTVSPSPAFHNSLFLFALCVWDSRFQSAFQNKKWLNIILLAWHSRRGVYQLGGFEENTGWGLRWLNALFSSC